MPNEVEKDANSMERCAEEKNGRSMGNTTQRWWRDEHLSSFEEGLAQLKEESLERAARSSKATTAVVATGFYPEVLRDLSKETSGKIVKFLEKVKQCWRWPQQTWTTIFCDSQERHDRTHYRASAHLDSLVGVLRAPEESRWKETIDGRNGRAERTVWETPIEVGKI